MPPDTPPAPGSSSDWLRHARSELAMAKVPANGDILLATLCFHAQQAAEKSIKAVLVHQGISFPKTHNLKFLLELVSAGTSIPPDVTRSTSLTPYAVSMRYPGVFEPVDEQEYRGRCVWRIPWCAGRRRW